MHVFHFFSPCNFPRALKQKKNGCVQKARDGMGNPGKEAWGISGRHGKSPGRQNPQDYKIPGKGKSSGWLNPREGKIPGTAKSREIPGRNC